MREDLEPTLFCAWCGRELGFGGSFLAFTLCKECVPLVKAEFRARPEPAGESPQPERRRRADAG